MQKRTACSASLWTSSAKLNSVCTEQTMRTWLENCWTSVQHKHAIQRMSECQTKAKRQLIPLRNRPSELLECPLCCTQANTTPNTSLTHFNHACIHLLENGPNFRQFWWLLKLHAYSEEQGLALSCSCTHTQLLSAENTYRKMLYKAFDYVLFLRY